MLFGNSQHDSNQQFHDDPHNLVQKLLHSNRSTKPARRQYDQHIILLAQQPASTYHPIPSKPRGDTGGDADQLHQHLPPIRDEPSQRYQARLLRWGHLQKLDSNNKWEHYHMELMGPRLGSRERCTHAILILTARRRVGLRR